MGFSQFIELLPGSGYGGEGIGAPIFVGRNRSLSLLLDVTDAPSDAAASVTIETSASQFAKRWRTLGAAVNLTGQTSVAISRSGADAFVRARYAITLPAGYEAAGLSLSGQADLPLLATSTITTAGLGSSVDVAQYHGGNFAVVVTAAPASQTLTVTVERSGDGVSGWTAAETAIVIAAAGEYLIESADLDRFVRVKYVPSSSGSWTFGVRGTSHLIFARARDRARIGIRTGAIPNVTRAQYLDAFLAATKTVISYYNRYDHPLRAWEEDTTQATIALADWQLLTTRAQDPVQPADGGRAYQIEADRWTQWLLLVAGAAPGIGGRKLVPSGIVDSAPANEAGEVKRWSFDSVPNSWGSGNGYGGGV